MKKGLFCLFAILFLIVFFSAASFAAPTTVTSELRIHPQYNLWLAWHLIGVYRFGSWDPNLVAGNNIQITFKQTVSINSPCGEEIFIYATDSPTGVTGSTTYGLLIPEVAKGTGNFVKELNIGYYSFVDPSSVAYGTTNVPSACAFTVSYDTTPPVAPAQVMNPIPANSATGLSNPTLQWAPVAEATSYDVYLGATYAGVNSAITSSAEYKTNTVNAWYLPALLDGTHYYWRIDSKNNGGTTKGVIWDFVTYTPPPPPVAVPGTNWQLLDETKYNPNRRYAGFCSQPTQCYNNNTAPCTGNVNVNTCVCINSTQSAGDNYCDSGNWTTRTRLVASKMIDFAIGGGYYNYSIFCGNITETGISEKIPISDVVNFANNFEKFCVMKYSNSVGTRFGFGAALKTAPQTALNQYINSCPTATSGLFSQCTDLKSGVPGKFYYNSNISSIIYLQAGTFVDVTSIVPPTTQFLNIIKNPFAALKKFLFDKGSAVPEFGFAQRLLNKTQMFDKLYIAKAGSKSIFALLQQGQYENGISYDYLIINYTGISGVPVCNLPPGGDQEGFVGSVRLGESWFCDTTAGVHTIKVHSSSQNSMDFYKYWLDLTSKLRLA